MEEFSKYISTLPKPLKEYEQKQLLIQYYQTRNEQIREILIERNLRLCAKKAMDFANLYNMPNLVSDAYSESVIALSIALDKFDPYNKENCLFSTYAGSGMDFRLKNIFFKEKDHSSVLDFSISTLENDEMEEDRLYFLVDDSESNIAEDIAYNEMLKDLLNCVSANHKDIMQMYLGVGYEAPLTQSQIAEKIHVSRQRVSQIINKELCTIRKYMARNYPDQFSGIDLSRKQTRIDLKNLIAANKEVAKAIFNDYYGANNGKIYDMSYLLNRYSIFSKASKGSRAHIILYIEDLLMQEGTITPEALNQLKTTRQARKSAQQAEEYLNKCAQAYYAYCGSNGYEKKSRSELSWANNVSRSTIDQKILVYKKYLDSLSPAEREAEILRHKINTKERQ